MFNQAMLAGADLLRLDDDTYTSPTNTAIFTLNTDGGAYFNGVKQYDWILPNSSADQYECRWLSVGNDPNTTPGAAGTWLPLTSSRSWTNTSAVLETDAFTLEVRRGSSGSALKSASIQLTADP